ncbi:hypothetical protein ACFYXS_26560 [Streptomyces sp. NPDC002574]|uniref:hypothetical protein n=1 Tax=Streptomyces sp. NPDC002574 TaxID=3364652 RepID=UPI00367E7B72
MRLAHNRNLGWAAVAKIFLVVTGRHWSAATWGTVGSGITPVTPELVADFGAVLDVPSEDLVAVAGIGLPDPPPTAEPSVSGVAELIWDLRDLTARQLREAGDFADSLRRRLPHLITAARSGGRSPTDTVTV